ncbi:MAG: hypothetical protein H2057_02595 [Alphaproteobacteria bacterium]|nr:hypothetical protein [Alphaproteobacteria bacterium]
MIPFFFVPLLTTTAIASEQTGLASPHDPIPADVHSVINQQTREGVPSDTQNAVEKALITKETLAKTDKVFESFDGFNEYMTQVVQWGAKLRSITVTIDASDEASLHRMANALEYHAKATNAIIINTSIDGGLLSSLVTSCFSQNPSLTSVTVITPNVNQGVENLLSIRFPNRVTIKKPM